MDPSEDEELAWQGAHLHVNRRGAWEFVSRNSRRSAVGIVAVHEDLRVVLVEQFRPPVGRRLIELPAGLAGDIVGAEDEDLIVAAKRELVEETGYVAAEWRLLVHGYSSPGLTDESITLFLAQGLERISQGGGVEGESIQIHEIPMDHILTWLRERKQSTDLKLLAALFAAREAIEQPRS